MKKQHTDNIFTCPDCGGVTLTSQNRCRICFKSDDDDSIIEDEMREESVRVEEGLRMLYANKTDEIQSCGPQSDQDIMYL